MKQKTASRKIKILVAKLGLDGHERGALVLCRGFRDAGMEVIYSGLFATPDRVAQIAEDEDVDAVALSLLNGAHGTLFPRVVKELKKKGINDVIVPPPTTSTSLIPFFFNSLTTLGNNVPCAPFKRLSATASTSSSSAICATLSGVANKPE